MAPLHVMLVNPIQLDPNAIGWGLDVNGAHNQVIVIHQISHVLHIVYVIIIPHGQYHIVIINVH
jgi:hypothetical protein